MNRFRNVLVYPAELSTHDPAVATASDLARATGAQLTFLSIDPAPEPAHAPKSLGHRKWVSRQPEIETLARETAPPGRQVVIAMREGVDPAQEICRMVEQQGFDLVIKTARPGDVPTNRVFSSTATRLLRECACPVWIVRGRPDQRAPRVLAAVDPMRGGRELRHESGVVEVAAQLAAARKSELHVVSAWRLAGESLLARRVPRAELESELRDYQARAETALSEFLTDLDLSLPDTHTYVVQGDAATVIAELAKELDVEMVVVGSAGRTGFRRLVLGNTAEEVLRLTPRALVGVRAEAQPASPPVP